MIRVLVVRGLILFVWMLAGAIAGAQEKTVQLFSGTDALTTATFQVADKWEVQWDAPATIGISVFAADGTLVTGASGSHQGSVYQPKGGKFYLQVNGAGAWQVSVVELGAAPAATADAHYVPPLPANTNGAPALTLQPPPQVPTIIATPQLSTAPEALTRNQARAIVVVKGDYGEGTGFLVHIKQGPAVVTNIHVIAANPHIRILTTKGMEIETTSLLGASDRDLAIFLIKDNHYNYLELADDVAALAQAGDDVITPGNSQGGEVLLDTKGDVLGIGPGQIEISNPVFHGNSGGPVFHVKSGKVIGVVTAGMKVRASDELDRASAANANSAISGSMRYFALRLDTVPTWETYDPDRFLSQTIFLKSFEELSRCLDSYLNGARYEKAGMTSMNIEEGMPNSHYYMKNEKVREYVDTFHQASADSDRNQRLDAQRELIMDLQGQADRDLASIQNPANFYSFLQLRAKYDYTYRKALRDELENLGNKVSDQGH